MNIGKSLSNSKEKVSDLLFDELNSNKQRKLSESISNTLSTNSILIKNSFKF